MGLYHAGYLSAEHGDERETASCDVAESGDAGHGGYQILLAGARAVLLVVAHLQRGVYVHPAANRVDAVQ